MEEVAQVKDLLARGNARAALWVLEGVYRSALAGGDCSAATFAANWIGHVQERYLGSLAEALRWFDNAEAAASRSADGLPKSLAIAAFNAGLVNEGRGRTTAAAHRYNRAAVAAASAGDTNVEGACRHRLGAVLIELGRAFDGQNELRTAADLARRSRRQLEEACRRDLRTALLRPEANPAHEFDVLARAGLARSVAGIELSGPGAILDAGCGSGAGLQALADRWPAAHITGVDLPSVATAVRLPRPLRTRVVVRGADLMGPLEEHPTFDAALCHSVLHEVVNPDPLLRTVARSLRPGGQLSGASFTTAYYEQVWSRLDQAGAKPPQPGIRHRPDRIEAALWSAGFTNVETWTEDVAVQVSDQLERSYLQRVLGRPLEPGELDRLMDVVGRPLVLDLSPLHFRALASHR